MPWEARRAEVGLFFCGLEDSEGVLAGLFCGVEGLVGPAGDVIGAVVGVVLAEADADGHRNLILLPCDGSFCNGINHTLGHDHGIADGGTGQDDGEFIAAVTGGDVDLTDRLSYTRADFLDDLVACAMAEGVIYGFEVINVNHNKRDKSAVAPAAPQLAFEDFVEGLVVHKSGQAVGCRLALHFFEEIDVAD